MKKILTLLLAVACCLSLGIVAISAAEADEFAGIKVMTHDEYIAAEIDAPVVVEAYVQATQSWWNDQITVYLQDRDGGYLAYNMVCSQEDAAKLVPGTKIQIKGYKADYAGEIEIADATFTFVENADTYIAEAQDLTAILADEKELVKHQNELASFKGVMIEKIEYKGGKSGDDIYVTVKQGANSFSFCVERYLTVPDTDVYKAFETLKVGDVIDVTGFVYWYNGVNTHITAIDNVDAKVMTHDEYIAAELDAAVKIESYVQATQSWWNNQITVYLQDENGGYLAYNLACSEDDAAKLVPGTRMIISGYKADYAGEVEIADAMFVIVEDAEAYIAEAQDLTAILADEAELVKHQNELAMFKGLTVENVEYKGGEPGDDIYVTVKLGDDSFSFCVERYLTAPDTEVYKAFETIKVGDVVDITGFVYWYNGVNTHITKVEKVEKADTTETTTESTTEPTTEPTAEDGCKSMVGAGVVTVAALVAAGLVSFKKKED